MRKSLTLVSLFSCVCVLLACDLYAQSLPVGTPLLEDYYRRLQLLGRVDSTLSFSVRPMYNTALLRADLFDPDSSLERSNSKLWNRSSQAFVQLLPVNSQHQYTTTFPYGWNDGAMIPNVGYQTFFSAGLYAEYKFLSVQLRPELVFAENSDYMGFSSSNSEPWRSWYWYGNFIDMPERFGSGSYAKAYLGQSSVRLNYRAWSLGLSTENLWWGPGMRNSLLMTNTAPGFAHITLNTRRPIRTPIGSFEGQIATGRLEPSGYDPRNFDNERPFDNFYRPKPDDWRYFQGFTLSYQPKWLPGLSMGVSRSYIINSNEMGTGFSAYFPMLGAFSKSSSVNPETGQVEADVLPNDEYLSFFARWVIPDAKAEVYAEWGRDDAQWDFRDLMVQTEHTRAYTVGFRKLVDLNNTQKDLLQLQLEVTHLENPKTAGLRTAQAWYTHDRVPHGYTNRGQLLGAGIGPGSNVQTFGISWLRGLKQLGIQAERLVHNNDLFYPNWRYGGINDIRRSWVDLSLAAHGEWDYKNFIFNARLQLIQALNYQYELVENPDPDLFWDFNPQDRGNFQMQLGVGYRF